MEILLGILIGFLLSEFICFLITIVTGSETKGVVSGCFIFFILFVCVSKLVKLLRVVYIRHSYVPFALCGYYNWTDESKTNKEVVLRTFRIKPKNIKKYRDKIDAYIEKDVGHAIYYYFKESNGKYVENAISIDNKRNRNDKFNYKWIKENMLREK